MKRTIAAVFVVAGLLMTWALFLGGRADSTEGIGTHPAQAAQPQETISLVSSDGTRAPLIAAHPEGASAPVVEAEPSLDEAAGETALGIAEVLVKALDGGARIEGAVAVANLNAGLSGAMTDANSGPWIDGPSGADGRLGIPIDEVELGDVAREVVTVKAPGFAQSVLTVGLHNLAPAAPVEVFLARGGTVEGTVTVAEGESYSAEDLHVELVARLGEVAQPNWSLSFGGDVTWTGRVAADGYFRVDDLVPGRNLKATIYREDELLWSAPAPVTVASDGTTTVTWAVGGGATVRAKATDATGGPVAGLAVMLDSPPQRGIRYYRSSTDLARFATTDDWGECTFEKVLPGPWALIVAKEQPSSEHAEVARSVERFTLETQQAVTTVEMPIQRALYITGRVLGWDGTPARVGAQAIGVGEGDGSMLSKSTADDGFRIGPLLPGEFDVHAGGLGGGENAVSLPVRARAGDSDLVIQLRRGGSVSGEVIDAQTGEPIGAQVTYQPIPRQRGGYTSHADTGEFNLGGILAGRFILSATASDGREAVKFLEIEEGDRLDHLVIEMAAATFLDLRYVGTDSRVYVSWLREDTQLNGTWVTSGDPARLPIPPGTSTIAVGNWKGEAEEREWTTLETREVSPVAGETLRIDLESH